VKVPLGRAGMAASACIVLALATDVATAAAQVAAAVEVTVRSASRESEGPLPGASVSIPASGFTATTDAAGKAVLRGIAPGHHVISVDALGFATATLEVDAANGRTARVETTLVAAPLELTGLDVRVEATTLPAAGVALETASLGPTVLDVPGAIDRVPGATVVRRGGPGAPAVVQLRGSSADQVLVLLDGVAVNSPVTGEADLSTIDLESLERIVVVPGAASARYGPRALGGVVLLESREVDHTSASMTASTGAWAQREIGGSLTWSPSEPWSIALGSRWSRADGDFTYEVPDFRGGGEAPRANASYERTGGDIRVARSGPIDVSLRGHASSIERGSPGSISQPSETGGQAHRRYGASAHLNRSGDDVGISLTTAVQWQRAEYADTTPPFGQAYDARTNVRRGEGTVDGWWASGPVTARLGAELARQDVESSALRKPALRIDEVGAWSRVEHERSAGLLGRLTLRASARVDRHDLVEETVLSPAVGATLTRGGASLELSWGQGFSPPGLGDLLFHEGVLVEPNLDLRPERVRNEMSLAVRQRWSPGSTSIEVRGAGYRADVEDMILWFPDFRFVWSPENFDVSRRGAELGASLGIPAAGRTHSLSVDVAWSEVEYTGGALSGQVAYRPEVTGDATVTLLLPFGALSPRATHVGERRSAPGSELNLLPPYTLFDVGLEVPFETGPMSGRLAIAFTNVFDERAALLVDYPLPGRGWSTRLRLTPRLSPRSP